MTTRILSNLIVFLLCTHVHGQRIGGFTPSQNAAARYSSNLPEGTVFYEGFENAQRPGLPQGWTTQSNASTGFISGTAGDGLGQANENGFWPVPLHGIFALSNDDVCNCDKSQDKLTSPFIDASGFERLFLQFEAFQNGSGGQTAIVEVKADGLPWLELSNIPSSSSWVLYNLSIPSNYLKKSFQIRFHYSDQGNYASGLAIDNVLLTSSTIETLGIESTQLSPGASSVGSGQIHQYIPLQQARAARWRPTAEIRNMGTRVKNAIMVNRLLGPVNQELTSSSWRTEPSSLNNLGNGVSETLTPHILGNYTLEVELLTDSTDLSANDNLSTSSFDVVDSIYRWVAPSMNYNLGAWIQSTGDRYGCSFPFYQSDSLVALTINIHPASEEGARFRVKVFSYDTLSSSVYSSSPFELEESDIGRIKRLPIEARVSAGRKLIVIEKESGSERLVLALNASRAAEDGNALTKTALGNWKEAAYFPQMEVITMGNENPCRAYLIETITTPSCANLDDGSIALSVFGNSGNVSYAWSNGAGNNASITGLDSGTFTVTMSDVDGCTYEETYVISPTDTLGILPQIGGDSCGQGIGKIALNIDGGSAPYTVIWGSDTLGEKRIELDRGGYPIQVRDNNGCVLFDTIHVPGTTNLGVLFTETEPNCGDSNGSISTVAVGSTPLQFSWSSGNSGPTLNGVVSGVYTLTLTDSIGCSIVRETFLNDQNAPTISLDGIVDVECQGQATGSIDLSVGGGALPYDFQWSNGRNTEDIDSLFSGSYVLSMTDQQGCKSFGLFEVSSSGSPLVLDFNDRGNYCWKDSNAIIEALVSGGSPPYSYAWSNGGDGHRIDGLGAGSYQLTVTDLDGCSQQKSIEVAEGPPFFLQLDSLQEDTSTSVLINGSIWVSTYGGTPPYTHSWNDSIPLEDLLDIPNGVYSLVASDQLGCVDFFSTDLGNGPVNIPLIQNTSNSLRLYPNPVRSGQTLHLESDTLFEEYRLTDAFGRLIATNSIYNDQSLLIPKGLSGLFLLELWNTKGMQDVAKIMIAP